MIELSNERIEKILHEETAKKEESTTILRSIYTRYMRLYERYFADIDALNDDTISELRAYHEETKSLVKYYYLDIPEDTCDGIEELVNKTDDDLLGPKWHKYLFDLYAEFTAEHGSELKGKSSVKAAFTKQALKEFYDAMDYIFREGFGTQSQTAKDALSGLTGLFFGKE